MNLKMPAKMTSIKKHNIEMIVLLFAIFTKNNYCHMQQIINNRSNKQFKTVSYFIGSIWKNRHIGEFNWQHITYLPDSNQIAIFC